MSKVYKSKIGLELVIPLVLVFGAVLFLIISEEPGWLGLVIILPVIVFIVYMFMTTYYTISGNNLRIKCGFIINKTIDIHTINKISETNNPLSSPATSIDRLEITYREFDSILISPKQKKEFINEILALNPNVEVQFKKKRRDTSATTRK